MQHLADLLALLPLPEPTAEGGADLDGEALLSADSPACDGALPSGLIHDVVHDLGADLPAGHLHVWGGPEGAGKTAFLLCLAQSAAAQGRRVVYATYDLPPETLAMRLLAMSAGVDIGALPDPGSSHADGTLEGTQLLRARAARDVLSRLPIDVLPARGFSARSIGDRLVRMPFRADVLALDYLQGVIREPGSGMGTALRELSDLAAHLHVAVVCAVRSGGAGDEQAARELELIRDHGDSAADRVGWIQPTGATGSSVEGAPASGMRQAEVLHNRYGETPAVPLHLDRTTGSLGRSNPRATT